MKVAPLTFFIFYSLIGLSPSFALPQDQPAQRLVNAKTLKCAFSLSMTVDWEKDIPKHKVSDSNMGIFFDAIDLDKKSARFIGNAGAEELWVIDTEEGITFIEQTPSGNHNFTTVFNHFNESLSGFVAVHSRHINMLAPLPSQWHGICKVWD